MGSMDLSQPATLGHWERLPCDSRVLAVHTAVLFIDSVKQEWQYGSTVPIHTPQAQDIKWVQIIRPMATTHSWDSNQRLVDVPFEQRGL